PTSKNEATATAMAARGDERLPCSFVTPLTVSSNAAPAWAFAGDAFRVVASSKATTERVGALAQNDASAARVASKSANDAACNSAARISVALA
ncbi:hypothetical protein, partial [Clostridioides difficile]|uniref:hypothetical protein n=1 Tax=Clostridioides difficile TaxID=1496 RepID=UPI0018DE7EA2